MCLGRKHIGLWILKHKNLLNEGMWYSLRIISLLIEHKRDLLEHYFQTVKAALKKMLACWIVRLIMFLSIKISKARNKHLCLKRSCSLGDLLGHADHQLIFKSMFAIP